MGKQCVSLSKTKSIELIHVDDNVLKKKKKKTIIEPKNHILNYIYIATIKINVFF